MSVVINTNSAATVAANNLAASNTALQKSLNRLSSGSKIVAPSDDAGGLAVSMKLSAAARRQGAVETNIANATSLLQTQDGVLSATAKILSRISELKVLNNDVTKSSSDKANYNSEFKALQSQITANADEKFNGVALFGSKDLTVDVTEDGKTSVTAKGIDLLQPSAPAPTWSSIPPDAAGWTTTDANISLSGGFAYFHQNGVATVSTVQTNISGAFKLEFDLSPSSNPGPSYGNLSVSAGGGSTNLSALLGDQNPHHVTITDDGTNATIAIQGGSTTVVSTLTKPGGGALTFTEDNNGHGFIDNWAYDCHISNITVTNPAEAAAVGLGNIADVANAADLTSLGLTSIADAIKDTATYRAQNGATQSRLGFASELVTVNKANLEAATSRITDVDVAQESTVLARNNVLVSAGTSMLAQANQSSQMALKLLS